jgi:putative ABC transport system permease protein
MSRSGSSRSFEECEEGRSYGFVRLAGDMVTDCRHTIRSLGRTPGFASIVILTMALGTGVNTAMFSILYGTLMAPLPYPEPGSLVEVRMKGLAGARQEAGTSLPNLLDWIRDARSFEGLGAHRPQFFANLTGHGEAEEVHAWRLSAHAFALLRVVPIIGRGFTSEEDTAAGPRSAIISDYLWNSRFARDPNIAEKTIVVAGETFRIVGVMPDRFEFPPLIGDLKPTMWLSLNLLDDVANSRESHSLHIVGRLRRGVSIDEARTEIAGISERLAKAFPKENGDWPSANVSLLSDAAYVRDFRHTLLLLSGAAGLVLLIAAVNVAALLAARGVAREAEVSIRRALGVSTNRLVRQLLTESSVISIIGCAFGIALAHMALPLLKTMLEGSPRVAEIGIRPAVLVFSLGLALLAGLLAGVLPVLNLQRRQVTLGHGYSQSRRLRGRKWLVALEISCSLLLLSTAGLLIESLWRAARVDVGFRTDSVFSMRFSLPIRTYGSAQRVESFREELLRQVSAVPFVTAAGTNSALPMGILSQATDFEIEAIDKTQESQKSAAFANVSYGYLETMRIPVLQGRTFGRADHRGAPLVAIVSSKVARMFGSSGLVLGRRIRLARLSGADWFTVVGICGDVREAGPETEPRGTIYALSSQLPEIEQGSRSAHVIVLVVRTASEPSAVASAIRAVAAGIDKDQPMADFTTLRQHVDRRLAGRKNSALIIGLFAVLAVSLAFVGVFGLVSFSVSSRSTEIGIRLALGARHSTILAMFVRDMLGFGIIGIAAGIGAAVGVSHLLSSRIFGVSATAPHILGSSAAFVGMAIIIATLIATRRAMGRSPMAAIRNN